MLPGLGGVMDGQNFQFNYESWKNLATEASIRTNLDEIQITNDMIRCGPVTGAVENIGFANEKDFYFPYLSNAYNAGFGLCVGDGCPDEKLQDGIEAIKNIKENFETQ